VLQYKIGIAIYRLILFHLLMRIFTYQSYKGGKILLGHKWLNFGPRADMVWKSVVLPFATPWQLVDWPFAK